MAATNLLSSIKWSGLGEIGAKFITPITTIILARILSPDAFGVVAICNMLITFVDIFVEAGFNKYIVQRQFSSDEEKFMSVNVAFWTQITIAIILYLIIFIFKYSIAELLGKREYGFVLSIASLQLIFVSLSSTHTALLRRSFQFKKLFKIRLVTAIGPLCITVPLAIIFKSYWALVLGTLTTAAVTTILLFISSSWIPKFIYSFRSLKEMWGYSFWSFCEGLAHWAIWWVDIFIIGHIFTTYYIGLYKNSTQIVLSLFGMITSAMSPVLLASLSRISNLNKSNYIFYIIEQMFMFIVLPLGIIIYVNQIFVTEILLGAKWIEAAPIIGLWSIMMSISLIIYSFPAEAFKARGIPQYLFAYQVCYLVFIIPICIITAKQGFWEFIYWRCSCIIFQIILFIYFSIKYLNWRIKLFFKLAIVPIYLNVIVFGIYYFLYVLIKPNVLISVLLTMATSIIYVYLFMRFHKKTIKRIKGVIINTSMS